MRKQSNESGRSMLEMIAVLIIIGLLTVGGLTGYSYLVQRHRKQETVKEVAELVLGVKSASLARRHEEGVTIAAREVVQGPKMDASGEVIRLPEGENSFAVVTNLSGGAFALNLQLEKGTCQALLEALKNEDITMFMPSDKEVREGTIAETAKEWAEGTRKVELMGVKYNVKETESDKQLVDSAKGAELRKKILSACEGDEDAMGRAAWVFDCSKGSSSYGYLYDLFCSGCPIGTMKDARGTCCSYTSADRCGNLCSCPQGTMCDKNRNECVECATVPTKEVGDAQCKNIYKRVWGRHVCDGSIDKCVECLVDKDCCDSRSGYDDAPGLKAKFCVSKHCVECNANYGEGAAITTECSTTPRSSNDAVPCPTATLPLCQNGTCTTCPEGQEWRDGECQCPAGLVKDAEGKCQPCVDDAYDHATDKGCTSGTPVCSDVEGTNSFGLGGTGKAGQVCYECVIDENCSHNPTNKYCGKNFTCVPCSGAWDRANRECRNCQDNNSQDLKDKGCEDGTLGTAKRLCKPDNSNDNGSQLFGDACNVCRNNNYGDNNDAKDDGCSMEKKLCHAADGTYGDTCELCQNDRSGATKDSGCDDRELPMCAANDGAYGTSCAKCLNDKGGNNTDTGCSEDKPMCQAADGAFGTECRNCPPETPIWSEKAGACKVCYDSVSGTQTDMGCGEGKWAGKPICATTSKKNDGTNDPGDSCAVCQNDKTEGVDTGCSDATPLCDANQGEFGSSCKACPSGQVWNGKVCAVCFDTATGITTDNNCGAGTWAGKPVCGDTANNGQGAAGTACYKCYDSATGDGQDAGCSAAEPKCVTTVGKYGDTCEKPCSGNDKCMNAEGQCIAVNSYDDIVRGSDGKCECLGAVKTQTINDVQSLNYSAIHKDRDIEYNCKRLQTHRKRLYTIEVNFYCPRYMHVSDSMQADDYVASSTPAGVGVNSPAVKDSSWATAHINTITPKVSSATIQRGTAKLVVSDRWAGEVGLNSGDNRAAGGYFYFTTAKNGSASGAPQKLTVKAQWNPGSTATSPLGSYVCRKGAGSSRLPSKYKKKCSNYCG